MRRLLVALFAFLLCSHPSHAQPSLAGEDQTSFTVAVDGQDETVSVIKDARVPDKWYYVPTKPRLAIDPTSRNKRPAVSLTMFQFPDLKDPSKEDAGGWLTMTVTFALPGEALAKLKGQIEKEKNNGVPILLDALPLTNCKAYFFSDVPAPKDDKGGPAGRFIEASFGGQDHAPRFASQQVVFSVFLNKNGADLLKDGLLNNKLPVWVMLEYQGLTPKLGFTITADWDAFQKHYSTHTNFAAQASWFGLFGGGTNLDWKKVREELVTSKSIKVEAVTGETFKQEDVDRYLQPVLKALVDGIAEDFKPREITAAVASPAKSSGILISAGFSRAVKDVQYRKTGKFTMDFSSRMIATAPPTWTADTLGVKGRPEADHVSWVKNQLWEAAYLKMPDVPTANELGVTAVSVFAELRGADGKQIGEKRELSWTAKEGGQWSSKGGRASSPYLYFPLRGLGLKDEDFKQFDKVKFGVTMKVTRTANPPAVPTGEVLTFESVVPASNGTVPVSSPWEAFQLVSLDANSVSFDKLDPDSKLKQLFYDVVVGGKKMSGTLRPYNDNGKFVPPPTRVWLADKSEKQPLSALKVRAEVDGKFQEEKVYKLELGQTQVNLDDRIWKK